MSRIKKVRTELKKSYLEYNKKTSKPLPELDILSEKSLKKLLDAAINRQSIASHKNDKSHPQKLCSTLRGNIADLLLLMDNFDIKEKKDNNGSKESSEKEKQTA